MTATEVAREFSSVVNRVSSGEEVEVVRNGVPVAQMRPIGASPVVSASRWRELMAVAPPVDEEFERDLDQAREEIGPPRSAWQS